MMTEGKVNDFKGWDFLELAEKWGLQYKYKPSPKHPSRPTNDDSKPIRRFLESLIKQSQRLGDESLLSPYANDIRMYTRKLAQNDISYYRPLWRGLARIEDDFTLVRATILLLPCMWS